MKKDKQQVLRTSMAIALACVAEITPSTSDAFGGVVLHRASPAAVVVEHRTVLSAAVTQSTVWDQLIFDQMPGEFAWIFPVPRGTSAQIGVGHVALLDAVVGIAQPTLVEPPNPRPCLTCEQCNTLPDAGLDEGLRIDAGPNAHPQDQLGPFATNTVSTADLPATRQWFADRSYLLTAAAQALIDEYAGAGMDLIVARFRPAPGATRVAPVRVTLPGMPRALPLRMLAIGAASSVRVRLHTVGAERWVPSTAPFEALSDADFAFDYNTRSWPPDTRADLEAARRAHWANNGGRTWLSEGVSGTDDASIRGISSSFAAQPRPRTCDGDGGGDDGSLGCVAAAPTVDADRLLDSGSRTIVIEPLSALLATSLVSTDLELVTRPRPAIFSSFYQYAVSNAPSPPMCTILVCSRDCPSSSSSDAGSAAMDASAADSGAAPARSGGCAVHPASSSNGIAALSIALLVARAARGRRRSR